VRTGGESDIRVVDRPERERFELWVDKNLAGFIQYQREGDQLRLIHTEIASLFQGRGLGQHLVGSALDEVRRNGMWVLPLCPFIVEYLKSHPEYGDLAVTT